MDVWAKYSVRPGGRSPEQKTDGAAGYDLHASEADIVPPYSTGIIKTGVSIELPPGFFAQVVGRSGLNAAGIAVLTGTIDNDYRGDIGVVVSNLTSDPYFIAPGDRIAQLVIFAQPKVHFIFGDLGQTARGNGGFGSTGK